MEHCKYDPELAIAIRDEQKKTQSENSKNFGLEIAVGRGATLPKRMGQHSAGYVLLSNESVSIEPGACEQVGTGLHMSLDCIDVALVSPYNTVYGSVKGIRESTSRGIDVFNDTIDPQDKEEIKVLMINNNLVRHEVKPGDHIAQLLFCVALTPV